MELPFAVNDIHERHSNGGGTGGSALLGESFLSRAASTFGTRSDATTTTTMTTATVEATTRGTTQPFPKTDTDFFTIVDAEELEWGGDDDIIRPDDIQQQQQQPPQANVATTQTKLYPQPGDVLSVLLLTSSYKKAAEQQNSNNIMAACEEAHKAARDATESKQNGNISKAISLHKRAAKLFHAAATKASGSCLQESLLVMSKTHARTALSLRNTIPQGVGGETQTSKPKTKKERLQATVRGALGRKMEADLTESTFLGTAQRSAPKQQTTTTTITSTIGSAQTTTPQHENDKNPVDEMLQLEKELRDMDMALKLGNSVASLGTRSPRAMKQSVGSVEEGGSFMMVAPGSSSASLSSSYYMSSSALWRPSEKPTAPVVSGTAGVRARANRVQVTSASCMKGGGGKQQQTSSFLAPQQLQSSTPCTGGGQQGLESSWWGQSFSKQNSNNNEQLAMGGGNNTKQIMRLLDSIRVLSDENKHLVKEVENADAARREARAAREQMKRFKLDYAERFAKLREALEKFRKEYPKGKKEADIMKDNPVTTSDFARESSYKLIDGTDTTPDEVIAQLKDTLQKERETGKKKDVMLRKYANFYREMRARSAEKAKKKNTGAVKENRDLSKKPV